MSLRQIIDNNDGDDVNDDADFSFWRRQLSGSGVESSMVRLLHLLSIPPPPRSGRRKENFSPSLFATLN